MLRRLWVGDMLGVGWITLMSICRVSPQEPVLRAREEAAAPAPSGPRIESWQGGSEELVVAEEGSLSCWDTRPVFTATIRECLQVRFYDRLFFNIVR